MTIETRTTIEPKDIVAIEFECAACHTKNVHKIDKFSHPAFICYTCHPSKILVTERSSEHNALVGLVTVLRQLAALEEPPFIVRLEIQTDKT